MNKAELIATIAAESELSQAAAKRVLDSLTDCIVQAVAKGDDVTLVGFGSFKSSQRAARTGKNPKTGEPLKIAATVVPKFTAGAGFKSAVTNKMKK